MKPNPLLPILEVLESAGFVPAGHTDQQTVRIPTSRSPVYGRTGGELATFGGRQRFVKPGTDMRVTVGKRTVYVYTVKNGETRTVATYNTKDVDIDCLRKVLSS